jgi:Ca2+-binding RTX toxin-like protein
MRFPSPIRDGLNLQSQTIAFLSFFVVLTLGIIEARAQIAEAPPSHDVNVHVDSGFCDNTGEQCVVWSKTLTVKDAKWLQLQLGEVVLTDGKLQSSKLKITSLKDGAVQLLDSKSCAQWQDKSAFFNGDSVKIELMAHAGAKQNRVVVDGITAGESPGRPQQTICGSVDNRQLSGDVRVGRTNNGCTAWLFDDRSNCMITAGHCAPGMDTVFFNVPISNANGTLNFPPPEDQYAVDPDSIQFSNSGIGNDWCYFGCFNNSTTGLSPFEAQGDSFELAVPTANTFDASDFIRITGFGVTSAPVSPTFNQAQKTHAGPFVNFSGTILDYQADTTGGNSGSPVVKASSGIAYGVHTHGGCNSFGSNAGTGYNNSSFRAAIAAPQGICAGIPAPLNDQCENATKIRGGTFDFDTTGATTDGPALPADCDEGTGLSFVNDIWYRHRATCTGTATFDFCSSQYDTRVAAYVDDGNCTGSLLACNDDSCGVRSKMTLEVVKGADYLIRVGGFSGGGEGTMVITCQDSNCPVNFIVLNNELNIDATQGPDDILVAESDGTLIIRVNNDDCIVMLPVGKITRVNINGYGGADTIRVIAPLPTTISGGTGADEIFGGPLENDILGGPGPDRIFGGAQNDMILAGQGQDSVSAFAGDDIVFGGDANDILRGGLGADELLGGLGSDWVYGEGGNDTLTGNAGADLLNGGPGNDQLEGQGGSDRMFGGGGNDTFLGGEGIDTFSGGSGIDTGLDEGETEISIEN